MHLPRRAGKGHPERRRRQRGRSELNRHRLVAGFCEIQLVLIQTRAEEWTLLLIRAMPKPAIRVLVRLQFCILCVIATLMERALVLDKRAGTLAIQACRALARRGYRVDIFGMDGSIAFNSKYCSRSLALPFWEPQRVADCLKQIFAATRYDAIYLCNEEILAIIPLLESVPAALPIPEAPAIRTLLSKHETLDRVRQHGVPAPFTVVPKDEKEAQEAAREMKLPFLIKGERGDNGKNLRWYATSGVLHPFTGRLRGSRSLTAAGRHSSRLSKARPTQWVVSSTRDARLDCAPIESSSPIRATAA